MVILLIVILTIIIIALRLTSIGTTALVRMGDRLERITERAAVKTTKKTGNSLANKTEQDLRSEEVKSCSDHNTSKAVGAAGRTATKGAVVVEKTTGKVVRTVTRVADLVKRVTVDLAILILKLIRRFLIFILPYIVVLDIIVLVVALALGSVVLMVSGFGDLFSSTAGGSSNVYDAMHQGEPVNGRSKIILVGDSRTVQLSYILFGVSYRYDHYNIDFPHTNGGHDNDWFVAGGAMGLSWMKTVENEIDAHVDADTAVVINMGTNDAYSTETIAAQYIDWLLPKADEWVSAGAAVYFLSTNPVDDNKTVYLKNSHVERFNEYIKTHLNSKVTYLDYYSIMKSTSFSTDDSGLHYDRTGYQGIWDFIVQNVRATSSPVNPPAEGVGVMVAHQKNSSTAFSNALNMTSSNGLKFSYIECDVSGSLELNHGSDGNGYTLDKALDEAKSHNVGIVVDMKSGWNDSTIGNAFSVVKSKGMWNKTIFQTGNTDLISIMYGKDSSVRIWYLNSNTNPYNGSMLCAPINYSIVESIKDKIEGVNACMSPYYLCNGSAGTATRADGSPLTVDDVSRLHSMGLRLCAYCFTSGLYNRGAEFYNAGVDYLMSNDLSETGR